ncbi:MAG TPA: lysylphosphatidylglycerol synthase transmembrane domain-containing protein [Pseudolysinimonas sp.]|jgi:hypothetical protein
MRIAVRVLAVVVLVAVLRYVVIPQFVQADADLKSVHGLSPWTLLTGLALELASLAALAGLTRSSFDPRDRPGFATVLRIDLAGISVTNAVPAGSALALAVRYRLFARAGSRPPTIVGGFAAEGILSNLLLGGVFAAGLLLSIADVPPSPYYLVAAVVMVAIFGTASVTLAIAIRHREGVRRLAAAATRRMREQWQERIIRFLDDTVGNVAALAADRPRFGFALFWGAVNWLLDIAALWVFLAAFGYHAPTGQLMLIYGLTSILAIVPITPGGVGIIEGVMVPLLIASGAAPGAALLGVIAWRLVQFWMPIPVGGLTGLSLLAWPDRLRRPTS